MSNLRDTPSFRKCAADWLISITPALARIRAEQEAEEAAGEKTMAAGGEVARGVILGDAHGTSPGRNGSHDAIASESAGSIPAPAATIPESILAKRYCVSCGKGENDVPMGKRKWNPRECNHCYYEALRHIRQEERDAHRWYGVRP